MAALTPDGNRISFSQFPDFAEASSMSNAYMVMNLQDEVESAQIWIRLAESRHDTPDPEFIAERDKALDDIENLIKGSSMSFDESKLHAYDQQVKAQDLIARLKGEKGVVTSEFHSISGIDSDEMKQIVSIREILSSMNGLKDNMVHINRPELKHEWIYTKDKSGKERLIALVDSEANSLGEGAMAKAYIAHDVLSGEKFAARHTWEKVYNLVRVNRILGTNVLHGPIARVESRDKMMIRGVQRPTVITVEEFRSGTNLKSYVRTNKATLKEQDSKVLEDKMIKTIEEFHAKGLTHGDLHTANIMYDAKTGKMKQSCSYKQGK